MGEGCGYKMDGRWKWKLFRLLNVWNLVSSEVFSWVYKVFDLRGNVDVGFGYVVLRVMRRWFVYLFGFEILEKGLG